MYGLDQNEIRQIFSTDACERIEKGRGTSLALLKYIVEPLKGKILVNSKKGNGSNFAVYLPAVSTGATPNAKNRGEVALVRSPLSTS